MPWPPEPLILRTPWCKADGTFTKAVRCVPTCGVHGPVEHATVTPMTERVHLFGNETTEENDEQGGQHVKIVCNVGYVPWPPEPLILRTPWCKSDGNFTRAVSCRFVRSFRSPLHQGPGSPELCSRYPVAHQLVDASHSIVCSLACYIAPHRTHACSRLSPRAWPNAPPGLVMGSPQAAGGGRRAALARRASDPPAGRGARPRFHGGWRLLRGPRAVPPGVWVPLRASKALGECH